MTFDHPIIVNKFFGNITFQFTNNLYQVLDLLKMIFDPSMMTTTIILNQPKTLK
jgi:hypothetical protein